jgi:hypothetical protein
MYESKYFFQGFLFMFGLATVPFLNEVKPTNKIASYWEKIASHIQNAFHAETSK